MLLTRVTLDNFGVYGGVNKLDFKTAPKKPVVLYGGTNGAGKTTVFESILLCLYGRQSFEQKMSQKQYDEKMQRLIHRSTSVHVPAQEASITVEFEFAHRGVISEYRVARSWENIDGSIQEDFSVYKKDAERQYTRLDSVEKSGWQSYIDQMMPVGIARLFFINGEHIRDIATAGDEQKYIQESFDVLLGLDLVRQLRDDIGVYLLRNSDGQTQKILEEIQQQTAEKTNADNRLERILEKQVSIKAQITSIQYKIRVLEERFSKIGGEFAKNREEFVARKSKMEAEIETVQKKIREMCSDTLPMSIIPDQLEELRLDIEQDEKRIKDNFERDILEKAFDDILETIQSDSFLHSCDDSTKAMFVSEIEQTLQKRKDTIHNLQNTTFDLSLSEMERIKNMINEINESCEPRIKELAQSHNKILDKLEIVRNGLEMSPQDDEAGPALSEIAHTNRKLGELESELENLMNLEAQEKSMITLLNSRIRQNISKRGSDRRLTAGVDLGPAIQETLEEYSVVLRRKKIEILQKYILDGIKMLLHKKDFIESVTIDPETFEIKLYKQDGEEITRTMMSEGEIQMYVTTLVWGLAKTSGRAFPFVIDTPLARLDREHRTNMVENFYPAASHQTIILSTDSEINDRYYEKLVPHIAKSYILRYDSEKGRTMIEEGYFKLEESHAIKV